jgi:WD40 repeat protein
LNNVAIVAHSYPETRVFIVDLQSGEVEQTMTSDSYILDLVWTHDDDYLIGAGENGTIYIWSTETSEELVSGIAKDEG